MLHTDGAPWSRRRLLAGAAAVGAGLVSAGCARPAAARPEGPRRWAFTDDTRTSVGAPRRPRTVVAYATAAAALWEYGIRAVGVYGGIQTSGGGVNTAILGGVDLDRTTLLGRTWGQVNLEVLGRLAPDLVVDTLQFGAHQIEPNTLGFVRRLAPVVGLEVYHTEIPRAVHRFAQLAHALGGEVRDRDRTAFEDARRRLKNTIKARPRLRVLFVSADPDGLRVAREAWPGLPDLKGLGLDVVVPPTGTSAYAQKLSWEDADRYPADLILMDVRTSSLQRDQLATNRVWQSLPAVRAGQTAPWNPEPVMTYPAMTRFYNDLITTLERTHRLPA
ncbi:ABC transporter substrate-binding protein [Streptomyces rimosus]